MPRIKAMALAQDPIEQDFLNALKRLREGVPTDKKLKAAVAKGALKINISNVAKEAGRSRTLIGLDDCKYPAVREMIRQAKQGKSRLPTTHTQLIEQLRARVAELKVQADQYKAEATVHFLARIKAEKIVEQERVITARLKKELMAARKLSCILPTE